MVFHNLPFAITSIQIDNVEIKLENVNTAKTQAITIDKEFTELHLFGK
jgi:alpha-glucosidase